MQVLLVPPYHVFEISPRAEGVAIIEQASQNLWRHLAQAKNLIA